MEDVENGMLVGDWLVVDDGVIGSGKLSKYKIASGEFGYKNNELLKKSIIHYSGKTDVNLLQVKELNRAVVYAFGIYGLDLPDATWFDDLEVKLAIVKSDGYDGTINLN